LHLLFNLIMEKLSFSFDYTVYDSVDELDETRKKLIEKAVEAGHKAYAPYSSFHVGAAVLLESGKMISGSNQENASYPVGICAERTLLSFVHANHPEDKKTILAVSVLDTDSAASPCGLCRQTIIEYENVQKQSIEILLHNRSGSVLSIPSGSALLPLHFDSESLS